MGGCGGIVSGMGWELGQGRVGFPVPEGASPELDLRLPEPIGGPANRHSIGRNAPTPK